MRVAFVLLFLFAAMPAYAGDQVARFDIRIFGIRLGELLLGGAENRHSYATRSHMRTTGLVAVLARIRVDLRARGRRAGGHYRPALYEENMDTGREERINRLEFAGHDALDPATAVWLGMRDRPLAQGCAQDFDLFDGTRRQHLRVREVARDDGQVICAGTLERLSGYSPADMAEARSFAIRATFAIRGQMLRLQRLRAGTVHGTVSFHRR